MSEEQPGLCERYISAAWADLAAVAWYEFLTNGRGMLLIDFSEMVIVRLDEVIADVHYIRDEEIVAKSIEFGIEPQLCVKVKHAVFMYEPMREVIVVAKMPDGSMVDYLVEKEPSPPEAFLRKAETICQEAATAEVIN